MDAVCDRRQADEQPPLSSDDDGGSADEAEVGGLLTMGGRDQHKITAGAMLQTLHASVHRPVLLSGGGEGDAADGSSAGSLDDGEEYTQSESDIEIQPSSSRIKLVTFRPARALLATSVDFEHVTFQVTLLV